MVGNNAQRFQAWGFSKPWFLHAYSAESAWRSQNNFKRKTTQPKPPKPSWPQDFYVTVCCVFPSGKYPAGFRRISRKSFIVFVLCCRLGSIQRFIVIKEYFFGISVLLTYIDRDLSSLCFNKFSTSWERTKSSSSHVANISSLSSCDVLDAFY